MKLVKNAPRNPGVYFFRNKRNKILYIGKAANLRERLRSYFSKGADRRGLQRGKTQTRHAVLEPAKLAMRQDAKSVTWQTTSSPIEALILEAQLIKKYQPKYNVLLRDDKQYFYVGFTREDFPRIFLTHQPLELLRRPARRSNLGASPTAQTNADKKFLRLSASGQRLSATYVGPFTDGHSIKRVLKLLRRIFPYATHKGFPRHCLAYDLELCPLPKHNPEDTHEYAELKRAYRKNIKAIKNVLTGKRLGLTQRLKKEMATAAKKEEFELAALLRDRIASLENILEHKNVLEIRYSRLEIEAEALRCNIPKQLKDALPRHWPWRIEGYDISNIQGTSATGSMVTFIGTIPHKEGYRKFRIKTVEGANDVAMLKEVISRRLGHLEWAIPDIMLIDGGRPQLNAALEILRDKEYPLYPIPYPLVVSLAKRREELYIPGRKTPLRLQKNHPLRLLFMYVRDEAHRFAKRYHLWRRNKKTIPQKEESP